MKFSRRGFLSVLGLAPFVPKIAPLYLDDDDDGFVAPENCFHVNKHRVYRIESANEPIVGNDGQEWICSGFLIVEGLYCSDCGMRLGR